MGDYNYKTNGNPIELLKNMHSENYRLGVRSSGLETVREIDFYYDDFFSSDGSFKMVSRSLDNLHRYSKIKVTVIHNFMSNFRLQIIDLSSGNLATAIWNGENFSNITKDKHTCDIPGMADAKMKLKFEINDAIKLLENPVKYIQIRVTPLDQDVNNQETFTDGTMRNFKIIIEGVL